MLWKPPEASQSVPGVSRSLQECFRAPSSGFLAPCNMSQSVPECLTGSNGLQDIRDVSEKALQRTRMPECLHMARKSRASHSSMLPQVLVKITPITSIANGVIVAILSLVTLSATTIQTISIARGESAPSC